MWIYAWAAIGALIGYTLGPPLMWAPGFGVGAALGTAISVYVLARRNAA
jgi:hypothetical protein